MGKDLTYNRNVEPIVLDWENDEDEIFLPQEKSSKSTFLKPKILGVDKRDDLTFLEGPF